MKKNVLPERCLLIMLALSFILAGCYNPAAPGKPVPNITTDPGELAAPSSLKINSGDGYLGLLWNEVEGAAKYQVVYRAGNEGREESVETETNSCTLGDLVNGTEYFIKVRAGNQKGWSNYWSLELGGTPKGGLISPLNVQAVAGNLSADVSWDPVEDAVFYEVVYSDGETIFPPRQTTDTAMIITGLVNDVEYSVKVRAGDDFDYSEFCTPVTVTPFRNLVPPKAPVIAEAKDGAFLGDLIVTWNAAEYVTEEEHVTAYRIFISENDDPPSDETEGTELDNVLSHGFSELKYNTSYYIWAAAKNIIGWSLWSEVKVFLTRSPIVPAVPANLNATPANGTVHLNWTGSDNADKYEVIWSDDDFSTTTLAALAVTNCSIPDLINKTEYKFRVRAGSADSVFDGTIGWSNWSNTIAAKPLLFTTAPEAPDAVNFSPAPRYALNVSWDIPAGSLFFRVRYGESSVFEDSVLWKNGDSDEWESPPVTINPLADSTVYHVWVAAGNEIGWSAWTEGQGSTKAPIVPLAPDGLTTVTVQLNQLKVSWDPVINANKYQAEVRKDETVIETINIPGEDLQLVTSFIIGGLATGEVYTFAVRAGADEWGEWSIKEASPIVPQPASVTLDTGGIVKQLIVNWTTVSGITNYNVVSGTEDVSDPSALSGAETNRSGSSRTITGLENDTLYYVWVRSREGSNGNNFSAWTKASLKTKVPVLPEGIVSGLSKVVEGDRIIDIQWAAVTGADRYQINYGPAPDNFNQTRDVNSATSYQLSGLTNYTDYVIRVRAGNADGYTDYSTPITAAPRLPLPSAPVVSLNDMDIRKQLSVGWDAVNSSTLYEVKYGKSNNESEAVLWTASPISLTSTVIKNLDDDTLYYVWVRAQNREGWGPWGTASLKTRDASPIIAGAPKSAPSIGGLAAFEIGGTFHDNTVNSYTDANNYTGAIGTWLSQPNNNSNPPVGKDKNLLSGIVMVQWKAIEGATGYDVFVASAAASDVNDTIPAAPARPAEPVANTARLSYFVRDANPGNAYYIWIRAKNDAGIGPVSNVYSAKLRSDRNGIQTAATFTNMIERADYPKNLVTTVTSEGSVHLSWDRSDRASWYEVYYHTADITLTPTMIGEGWSESTKRMVPYQRMIATTGAISGTATPWNDKAGAPGKVNEIHKIHSCETTITGLNPSQSYWFWIRSLNHNGERGMAKINNFKPTMGSGSLAPPSNVSVKSVSPGGGGMLLVEWDAVSGASGYKVYYSKYNTPLLTLQNVIISGGSVTNYMLKGLDENNLYYVWVVSTDSSGQSKFGASVSAVVNMKDGTEPKNVAKKAVWGEPLKNFLYVEVNDNDPRVALNWELASGEKFFDVVVLFASNLRTRDCANASTADKATHYCTKSGPHIHHNGNVQHILDNRDKYIKPLQDAGIKVTMGLLGDHDRFIYYQVGAWPWEASSPWASYNGTFKTDCLKWDPNAASVYPMGPAFREIFLSHLADEIQKYGLDGFDFDDEWSEFSAPTGTTASNQIIARNYAEWIYIMRQKLGPDAVISLYDYNTIRNILGTSGATFNAGTYVNGVGYTSTNMVNVNPNVWNYATCSGYSMYGSTSANGPAGIPRGQYSPFALDIGRASGSTSYTTYTSANPKYGWVLFYALNSRAKGGTGEFNFINRYAQNLFGQNVVYNGPDYPRDWAKW